MGRGKIQKQISTARNKNNLLDIAFIVYQIS